jgi:hypothetical protein
MFLPLLMNVQQASGAWPSILFKEARTMRLLPCASFAVLLISAGLLFGQSTVQEAAPSAPKPAAVQARKLALQKTVAGGSFSFTPNVGQGPAEDLFIARSGGLSMALQHAGLEIETIRPSKATEMPNPKAGSGGASSSVMAPALDVSSVRLQFDGANSNARVEGLEPAQAKVNFLHGSDPSKWKTGISSYERVRYSNLYPGIDLVYYGERQRHLEYDLVVAPGADPDRIRLRITSKQGAAIDDAGDLLLDGAGGDVRLMRPMLYQNFADGKRAIAGSFVKWQCVSADAPEHRIVCLRRRHYEVRRFGRPAVFDVSRRQPERAGRRHSRRPEWPGLRGRLHRIH